MGIAEKIEALGNGLSDEVDGTPRGRELLQRFVNSSELPKKTRFWTRTSRGVDVAVLSSVLRVTLGTGIPRQIGNAGTIGRREAALGLLRWKRVKP